VPDPPRRDEPDLAGRDEPPPDADPGERDRQPRWHPLGRVALYFLVAVPALQLLAAVPAFLFWTLISGRTFGSEMDVPSSGEFLLFLHVFLAPATLFATLGFLRVLDRRELKDIGFRLPSGGFAAMAREKLLALSGTAAVIGLWILLVSLRTDVAWGGWSKEALAGPSFWPGTAGTVASVILIAAGFMIQGAVEELAFRGYIYRNFKDRWSWPNAAAATALLFALVHASNPNVTPVSILNTFLIGLFLAELVEWSGSLWLVSLLHGFWNFLVAAVYSLPVSGVRIFRLLDVSIPGPSWLTGGDYGPEGSLVLMALLIPLAFGTAYFLDRMKRSTTAKGELSPWNP